MSFSALLTPQEVAQALKVAPVSVYRWATQGVIPSIKIGGAIRFSESALAEFIARAERGTPADDSQERA